MKIFKYWKECLIVVMAFGIFLFSGINLNLLKADSGFDSSWDSGSSSDWGSSSSDWDSDWDSSSDSDWSSSSSSSSDGSDVSFLSLILSPIILLIFIVIYITFCAIVIKFLLFSARFVIKVISKIFNIDPGRFGYSVTSDNYRHLIDVSTDKLSSVGLDNNIDNLKLQAFEVYEDIQIAWMNDGLESVRNCLSDEMFNMYQMQLSTLRMKNQQNIMEDINYKNAVIFNVKKGKDGIITIEVKLTVTCLDYLINKTTKKVLRGDSKKINLYNYLLTFQKSDNPLNFSYCPKCGAPISNFNSTKCNYCNSIILGNSQNLVLVKKEMISQSVIGYKK